MVAGTTMSSFSFVVAGIKAAVLEPFGPMYCRESRSAVCRRVRPAGQEIRRTASSSSSPTTSPQTALPRTAALRPRSDAYRVGRQSCVARPLMSRHFDSATLAQSQLRLRRQVRFRLAGLAGPMPQSQIWLVGVAARPTFSKQCRVRFHISPARLRTSAYCDVS